MIKPWQRKKPTFPIALRGTSMASKILSLNSLLGRRRKPKENTDELAVVKAAAWAWYQHGSGSSEGKAMSEFDVTRSTKRAARPSRYKLEAMRLMTKEEGSPIHTKKPLLDTYEVQSISRQLDRLIDMETNYNKFRNGDSTSSIAHGLYNGERRMKKKNKRVKKGFWPNYAVVCGRGEDVVDHQLSAKRVPAVNLVKCLPRAYSVL